MLPKYISSSQDLVTSKEATKQELLVQAASKIEKSAPYVEEAKQLQIVLEQLKSVNEIEKLLEVKLFRDQFLNIAGVSTKAAQKFSSSELSDIVKQVIGDISNKISINEEFNFRQETLFRLLLSKGDSLGGQIRNWIGARGSQKFAAIILQKLGSAVLQVRNAKDSGKIQLISWENRLLVFDKTPSGANNIDSILLDTTKSSNLKELLADLTSYRACGELKGGIDPAGADEHWKTARTALDRIKKTFEDRSLPAPKIFFVGAAIETAMANEIFDRLQKNELDYAANLTISQQLEDLINWLLKL